jgi:hypothetical protein
VQPETRYAQSGDVSIAYPRELLLGSGACSPLGLLAGPYLSRAHARAMRAGARPPPAKCYEAMGPACAALLSGFWGMGSGG